MSRITTTIKTGIAPGLAFQVAYNAACSFGAAHHPQQVVNPDEQAVSTSNGGLP